jgi:hypothetical protein
MLRSVNTSKSHPNAGVAHVAKPNRVDIVNCTFRSNELAPKRMTIDQTTHRRFAATLSPISFSKVRLNIAKVNNRNARFALPNIGDTQQ